LTQAVTLLSYVPEVPYVFGSDGNASELIPEVAYVAGLGGNASDLFS